MGSEQVGQIAGAITQSLGQFISDVLNRNVKNGQEVYPDFSRFDVYDSKQKVCKAFRMKFRGWFLDDKELEAYLKQIRPTGREEKNCSDLDGDGRDEKIDHYTIKLDIPTPFDTYGKFCKENEWGPPEILVHQPDLYIVHFSKGGHAVVDGVIHLLRAEKK